MPSPVTVRISCIPDQLAIERMLELARAIKDIQLTSIVLVVHGESKRIALADAESDSLISLLLKSNGNSLTNMYIQISENDSRGIAFDRLASNPSSPAQESWDRIRIEVTYHNIYFCLEDVIKLNDHAATVFRDCIYNDIERLIDTDSKAYLAARELSLRKLEQLSLEMASGTSRMREELEKEFKAKRDELEFRYKEMQTQLESNLEERAVLLEKKEGELAERAKKLDDRSSMHVRRELREKLKETLVKHDRMKFTADTRGRWWAVFISYTVMLAVTGIPSVMFLVGQLESPDTTIAMGKNIALSVTFLLTMGFFIRWLNNWSERSTEEEFKLKQLDLDIDRASWLVELIFESQSSKYQSIPDEIIKQLSSNLFGSQHRRQFEINKASTVAMSIIDNISQLKLQIPSLGEVSYDKQDIRRINKKLFNS